MVFDGMFNEPTFQKERISDVGYIGNITVLCDNHIHDDIWHDTLLQGDIWIIYTNKN